jgi:hypothetical protein
MKVRFDTITSDSATSDADAGAKDRKDASTSTWTAHSSASCKKLSNICAGHANGSPSQNRQQIPFMLSATGQKSSATPSSRILPAGRSAESMSEPSFDHVKLSTPTPAPPSSESELTSSHDQEPDGTVARAPGTTDYTSAGSPSHRKTRRPLSVRLVDEYWRAHQNAAECQRTHGRRQDTVT